MNRTNERSHRAHQILVTDAGRRHSHRQVTRGRARRDERDGRVDGLHARPGAPAHLNEIVYPILDVRVGQGRRVVTLSERFLDLEAIDAGDELAPLGLLVLDQLCDGDDRHCR